MAGLFFLVSHRLLWHDAGGTKLNNRDTPKQEARMWAALFFYLLPVEPLMNQPNEASSAEMAVVHEETLVVAKPVLEEVRVLPNAQTITVVSADQIERLNASDLSAALRRVPGISLSRHNMVGAYGGGAGGAVFVRGHGSGRPGAELTTMIDGVGRWNGVWSHPLLDTLSLTLSDQIEVMKSPQGVRYGNMAFAAVNLVPSLPQQERTELLLQGGSHQSETLQLRHGNQNGRWVYDLRASHRASEGHRPNADGQVQDLFFQTQWEVSEQFRCSLLWSHTDSWASDPRREDLPELPRTETYRTKGDFFIGKLTYGTPENGGTFKLFWDQLDALWEQWDQGRQVAFDHEPTTDNRGVQWAHELRGQTWTLQGGVETLDAKGQASQEDVGGGNRLEFEERFRQTDAYVRAWATWGEAWALTPSLGVRFSDHNVFESSWSWEAGVLAEFAQSSLRVNAARANNRPGLYTALFYQWYWSFLPPRWQELRSETMDHLELGYAFQGDRLQLDVAVYHDRVDGSLRIVAPPPSFQPIGFYETQGVEVTLQWQAKEAIDVFTGVSFCETDPADVPNAPQWTGSLGVNALLSSRWTCFMDVEFVDAHEVVNTRNASLPQERVDAYLLANGGFHCRLTRPSHRIQAKIHAHVENLGDVTYHHQVGYPMPGRVGSLGLNVQF